MMYNHSIKFLSDRTCRILEEFGKVVLTPAALSKFSLEAVNFRSTICFLIDLSSVQVRWLVVIALWVFELGSVFCHFKIFTRLTPEKKDVYYKKWSAGRSYLRYLLMRVLLTFVYTAYYSHHEVAKSLGFADQPTGRKPLPAKREGILEAPEKFKEVEVEICVIGSGAGGAVVARELAEKGHEVLILEEGGYYSREDFRNFSTLDRNRLIYRDSGLFTTIGVPMVLVPTGKCVGGTTLINSGTCFRTPDSVLKRWSEEFGLSSLSAANLEPYFERVEKTLRVEQVPDEVFGNNDRVVRRGAEKLGLHASPLVRNAPGCRGSGVCIFGCPTGAKQSMDASYLPLAFSAGAKLYPHCHVERLRTKNDRVERIEACFTDPETGSTRSRLHVYPKKVVASCGAFFTPLLLKRSGIGRFSSEVGKNLTLHPTAKMMGIFDEIVDGFHGVPQAMGIDDYESEGIMYESVFFPPWLLATSIHHSQEEHLEIMNAYRRIAIFGFLVHDESRGRVLEGAGGRPLVLYSIGKRERDLFVKGLKVLARIFFSAGAVKIYPTIRTLPVIRSAEEMDSINPETIHRRDLESAAFHPLGTCRMGSNPRRSVIDENMRVHDVENLWIADGSVFPTSLGVNPQITIMAFAARCADIVNKA